jgi:crossover junction endodeoxyribonuclease RusA
MLGYAAKMSAMTITLPWPDKALSPNARVHWAVKAKAVKAARQAAGWATKAAGVKVEGEGFIYLQITFNPPSKRRHDLDNCVARAKSLFDGIADALGVDDSRFRYGFEFGESVKGGRVTVEIKQGAA